MVISTRFTIISFKMALRHSMYWRCLFYFDIRYSTVNSRDCLKRIRKVIVGVVVLYMLIYKMEWWGWVGWGWVGWGGVGEFVNELKVTFKTYNCQ